MMQRLGLAVATLSAAEVLLLDEPTAALDPDGLCAFYGLVEERKRAGLSTFFSSHQLGDVERMADRVAVLVSGRLAGDFSEREIAARLADRGVMRVRLGARVPALLNRIREQAPLAQWFGDELIIPGPAALRPAMLDSIRSAGADIMGLTAQEGRLDELYKDLIGGGS
jgi:Cu-processing system ATP-binding protein